MKEVKISFNKQTWNPRTGTYYRGCFTMDEETYLKFTNGRAWETEKGTGRKVAYMSLVGRDYLIQFLRKEGIPFNVERAARSFNYYIEVKS